MRTGQTGGRMALGLAAAAVWALPACKALNAAFGDNNAGASGTSGAETSSTDPPDTGAMTNHSRDVDSASGGDTTLNSSTSETGPSVTDGDDTQAGTMAETRGDSVGQTSSGEPADACDPYGGPLVHDVLVESGQVPCPGLVSQETALLTMRGEVLEVTGCTACPENCAGATMEIDLDASVFIPFDALPECGRVVLWGSPEQIDPCDWLGMSIFDLDENPMFVVSDSLEAPSAAGGMQAMMQERLPCDGECDTGLQPGRYSLSIGGDPVPEGQEGTAVVSVGGDNATAILENHGAVVNSSCETSVSWVLDFVSPP